jgi:hypothetical protein
MPRIKWDANGRDGKWVDDGYVAKDGETIRTPMFLQDSNRTQLRDTFALDGADLGQFHPGYRVLGDAQRAAVRNARDRWIADMSSAWKMDARKRKPPDDDEDEDNNDEDENGTGDRHPKKADDAGRYQAADRDARQYGSDPRRDGLDALRRPALEARAAWIRALGDAWRTTGGNHDAGVARFRLERTQALGEAGSSSADRNGREIQKAVEASSSGPGKPAMSATDASCASANVAYAESVKRLQDAWKRPGGYQPTPDPFQRTYGQKRPIEPRFSTDGAQPDLGNIQARRDAAWNSYKDQLSNAWKSPAGRLDPNRASGVEAERRAQTFENRNPPLPPSPGNGA